MRNETLAVDRNVLEAPAGEPVALRQEREKRKMSREEFAAAAGISVPWLRDVEDGTRPGVEARERIRKVLETCPMCASFGIKSHKLPVPPDEELYSPPKS
jgi:transcriptional regulator with XRE-family HTH domain